MKYIIHTIVLLATINVVSYSQSEFSPEEYINFMLNNQSLTTEQMQQQYPLSDSYFTGEGSLSLDKIDFGKTVAEHFSFTEDEISLLKKNRFFVSERLNYMHFGDALGEIYHADLPVFVSTDAILHALHSSYDQILISLEHSILEPNLQEMLLKMYEGFPELARNYNADEPLQLPLKDVDLYVTIAYSLIKGEKKESQWDNQEKVDFIWDAIQSEELVETGLFSETQRKLDFSQFTVRGHYEGDEVLEKYFKAMMWLGRTDFLLTPPPSFPIRWPEADIKRMNLGAFMLQELIDKTNVRSYINANDKIITFFIGESDNLTTGEYAQLIEQSQVSSAKELLSEAVYDKYYNLIASSNAGKQKILSSFFIMDPFSAEPDTLPVSYRLMGQKFILDSYVFSNVVYDRVIQNGTKVKRMMPDPLDMLFVMGNNDALTLLEDELDKYEYGGSLSSLRYLVQAYDDAFWSSSLYNIWLNSIRKLNPPEDTTGYPYFMKTDAFRMQKINTQMASWSQLRHDNLLYAKQSYTGGVTCSYPTSYVEPIPAFYSSIKQFAEKATGIFAEIPMEAGDLSNFNTYFNHLAGTMDTLQTIAEKEIKREPLTVNEFEFLGAMLVKTNGMCGAPPYLGWYPHLFYNIEKMYEIDFTVVDVHTQPTDETGNVVGKVLHTGVGKINMGFFAAPCPDDQKLTLYCGPVMSYYEKTTGDFTRMTDSQWEDSVFNDQLPARPEWVNTYLADGEGEKNAAGTGLPYKKGPATSADKLSYAKSAMKLYPNPATDKVHITCEIRGTDFVTIYITDPTGKIIETITKQQLSVGNHEFVWKPTKTLNGVYLCNIVIGEESYVKKIILQ